MSETPKPPSLSDTFTIAFYNSENLFDIYNDQTKHDRDYLPNSERRWTKKRYQNKIENLGRAISQIGPENQNKLPSIIGLAEIENSKVLKDLVNSEHLKNTAYKFVHYNSKDERGMDVALLYNETEFTVSHTEVFQTVFERPEGGDDYTRDILLVNGLLNNEAISVLVNHWPSRHEGAKATEAKRLKSSAKVSKIIADLRAENEQVKLIVMGDFNDDPNCLSITQLTENSLLYNPMNTLRSYNRGSLVHQFKWHLFDQILISTNFFDPNYKQLDFGSADIFDPSFLKEEKGRFKGMPFRTYAGENHKGGYSDHFPVYITLKG
ncbi:endonuclease/exonuclease/phosphatase family protein [Bizionia sp. KMM 8389]